MRIWTKFIGSSAIVAGLIALLMGGSSFILRQAEESVELHRQRTNEAQQLAFTLEHSIKDQTLALKDFLLLNRQGRDMADYQKAMSNFLLALDELETLTGNEEDLDAIRRRHSFLQRLADSLTTEAIGVEQVQQDIKAINSFSDDLEFYLHQLTNQIEAEYNLAVQESQSFRAVSLLVTRILIGAILVAFIVQFFLILLPVIRSIEQLQLGAERIGKGNLNYRLDIRTNDEIQRLASEFNQMAEKVANIYNHLEQKVAERTAELTQVNEDLTNEIAERQEAQKAQARLTAILEATTDFVGISTPQGEVVYVNQAIRNLMGFGDDTPLTDLSITHFQPQNFLAEKLPIAISQGLWSGEAVWFNSKGEEIPISQIIIAHKSENGDINFLSTVARDITERKKAEEALQHSEKELKQKATQLEETLKDLQKAQAQLVQTEKMSSLGQLVAGVAHEINNPVNFIYGNIKHTDEYIRDLLALIELYQSHYSHPNTEIENYIEEIELDFLLEDLPKTLASMKMGAERIREIVLSLRTFSRLDEADMKEVNIHEGIDSTLLILQNRLKARPNHPEIEVIKHYGDLPKVECYAGQLNQVFMNVLTNAIDVLDERNAIQQEAELKEKPASITITTEVTNNNCIGIRIADNGGGMTKEVQQRLFDPFFTTKPIGKGTGMGLAISYSIICDRHGGVLDCHSELGKGTEFRIEIPAKQTKGIEK